MIRLTEKAISAFNNEKPGYKNEPILRIQIAGVG